MTMTNSELIERFVDGFNGRNGSMTSENGKLYSYNTVIAQWLYNRTLVVNTTKYSSTTSRQQSILRRFTSGFTSDELIEVSGVYRDVHDLEKYID